MALLSGCSLLIAWQLKNKRVLVVGGGDVASTRLESILAADALITLISPRQGLHPLILTLIQQHPDRILYHDRHFFGPEDLLDVDLVLTAIDDVNTSREICALARARRIPVNVADIPPSCDFYFGSQIRKGPLQIMVSTNGQSPKLANLIKKHIEDNLPPHASSAIEKVGLLRSKLRERAPGVGGELSKRRMKWIAGICSTWSMEDLAVLNDEMMEKLLDDGWGKNTVPPQIVDFTPQIVGSTPRRITLPSSILPAAVGFVAGGLFTSAVYLVLSRRGLR